MDVSTGVVIKANMTFLSNPSTFGNDAPLLNPIRFVSAGIALQKRRIKKKTELWMGFFFLSLAGTEVACLILSQLKPAERKLMRPEIKQLPI